MHNIEGEKMKFKKIYIEILNYCNLNCKFCEKTKKPRRMVSIDEFKKIINEVKKYTDYIYLHVQGEPLLHPNLKEFFEIAYDNNIKVNLTTNATLIKNNLDVLINNKSLRQINISLQALQNLPNKDEYYDNIINLIKNNKDIYISLRMWGNFKDQEVLNEINYFSNKLNITPNLDETNQLMPHVFLSLDEEFKWPNLNDRFNKETGRCQAINQLGILSDGTVIPCCLDKDGIINLGNIFYESLDSILNSPRYQLFLSNFKKGIITEELCKHCTFHNRFDK